MGHTDISDPYQFYQSTTSEIKCYQLRVGHFELYASFGQFCFSLFQLLSGQNLCPWKKKVTSFTVDIHTYGIQHDTTRMLPPATVSLTHVSK